MTHSNDSRRVAMIAIAGAAALMAPAARAVAAPFGPPSPVAGFGSRPALAQVSGAALSTDGASAIVGTSDTGDARRAVTAFGEAGSAPTTAQGHGPNADAFDLASAANAAGDVAV